MTGDIKDKSLKRGFTPLETARPKALRARKARARFLTGFTMVELLIAGVVFSVIFGVTTIVFVSTIRIQKYNMAQQQILDQASYAIEYMARALRMAQHGGSIGCTNGANYLISGARIDFVNYKGQCQHFLLDTVSNQIKVGGGDFTSDTPLNSTRYTVNNLTFSKTGDSGGDSLQPRVTIFAELEDSRLMKDNPRINIQTTVSQRNLDE